MRSIKATTWLYVGGIIIAFSIVLQIIALFLPPFTFTLSLVGLILNAASVPLTIVQAFRSALEQIQLFEQERIARDMADQRVFSETQKGRTLGALSQRRAEVHMDN